MAAGMPCRIATFNAGLAVGVLPHTTERLPHVVAALAALDVDLLFVQEFWLAAHWEQLRTALSERLPHVIRPEPLEATAAPLCNGADLEPLRRCAQQHCAGLSDEALARCVIRNCAPVALGLPAPCLNCVASHPVGTLDEILARCVGEPRQPAANEQGTSKGLIAYGGSFGTGLLSRTPLFDPQFLLFDSSVTARSAIHARVELATVGWVHLFATHLSPGGAEHEPQVDQLIEWMNTVAGSEPALLIGDLNLTPGSPLFRKLERAGFREADPSDRSGTYSHDGLNGGRASSSYRLDHVLLRQLDTAARTRRILDRSVTLPASSGALETTLSDHFGVLATLGQ